MAPWLLPGEVGIMEIQIPQGGARAVPGSAGKCFLPVWAPRMCCFLNTVSAEHESPSHRETENEPRVLWGKGAPGIGVCWATLISSAPNETVLFRAWVLKVDALG
jgi:hypothetical protein